MDIYRNFLHFLKVSACVERFSCFAGNIPTPITLIPAYVIFDIFGAIIIIPKFECYSNTHFLQTRF